MCDAALFKRRPPTIDIPKRGVADAHGVLQHGRKHRLKIAGELLIIRSTSEVAVCCFNASFNSPLSRAISVSWLAAEELTGAAPFGRLRSFASAVLRRRASTGPPLALERRVIVFPYAQDKQCNSSSLAHGKRFGGSLGPGASATTYVAVGSKTDVTTDLRLPLYVRHQTSAAKLPRRGSRSRGRTV